MSQSSTSVLDFLDKSLIEFPPINPRTDYVTDHENRHELEKARKLYDPEKLNPKQKRIYNFFLKNQRSICLVQAGPGCGKSFLLNTIAHANPKLKIELIIFKKDLLRCFIAENIQRWTVAKFMMNLLDINYKEYEALEDQLACTFTPYEFMLIIISLLKASRLPNFEGSVVFLDEYTVIPKPLLFIILTLLHYYKIGAIICGDMYQLQNIHNSKHTEYLSSHSLASSFVPSEANFTLEKNERCSNVEYNEIIKFFSKLSSSKKLDEVAYAAVAAVFPEQLFSYVKFDQVHLAGTHEELTQLQHFLSCQNGYPGEFYTIDQSKLRNADMAKNELIPTQTMLHYMEQVEENERRRQRGEPTLMITVQKFLPYIPLVIGAEYYVGQYSEKFIGILKEIVRDDIGTVTSLKMFMLRNQQIIEINRSSNDAVIFERHKLFLLQDGKKTLPGRIYGFPIYLTNFKTMHQGQGCTIPNKKLNMILNRTTGEGLYVGASRVTDAKQIERVVIPNQIQHLISTIVNFPCLVRGEAVSAEILESKLLGGKYVTYAIKDNEDLKNMGFLTYQFFKNCTDVQEKNNIRSKIIQIAANDNKRFPSKILNSHQVKTHAVVKDVSLITLQQILKYRDLFMALSQINETDRNVWLHEFIISNKDMKILLPENFQPNSKKMEDFEKKESKFLTTFANLNDSYSMEIPSIQYIKSVAKTNIRTNLEDQIANEKYRIEELETNVYKELSMFCSSLTKLLTKNEVVTEKWLALELNKMLKLDENKRVMNPEKIRNLHVEEHHHVKKRRKKY